MRGRGMGEALAVGDLVELVDSAAAMVEPVRGPEVPGAGDRAIVRAGYGGGRYRVVCGSYPKIRWDALCSIAGLRLVERLGQEEALRRLEPAREACPRPDPSIANTAVLAAAGQGDAVVERAGGGWLVKAAGTTLQDQHGLPCFFVELEPTLQRLAAQGVTVCRIEFGRLHREDAGTVPTVGYTGLA